VDSNFETVKRTNCLMPIGEDGERLGRTWRCARGHVLGLVERDGSGKGRLHVFRRAIYKPIDAAQKINVVGAGRMEVTCSICGWTRTWVEG
jgi:hypothetical protein